ncbi:MAG: permease [Candidatus Dormibacteraeota bacterium]|uniref:Permease n=1 Tax=Candidatus Aeolococcus gillhamiae TaxID=3127015 RepID=A0A934JUS3_9BACT|nr:permease [Candidatus Dormibacteraeota bacterium]
MFVLQEIGKALSLSFAMFWQVLWPLALGFLLSAVVETLVSRQTISRLLGKDGPREVAVATALGAASSSCSYAAVAVARSLFRKGATLGNAIIFEFASTNLVFELGLVLLILLGWQFLSAELFGGLVMVVVLAIVFRLTLSKRLANEARTQAERGLTGRMEGHAAMDMSVTEGPLLRRAFSPRSITAICQYFFMNIYSLWADLILGFLIAGALGAWVSDSVWSKLFLQGHGFLSEVWGALIGPLVAVISFVCSVGNVPLAAVLWRGGISFGGVIAFIFADLIILPILNIYRKYYGRRVAVYLLVVSYLTMAFAGLVVGLLFNVSGLTPTNRHVVVFDTTISWNYDTFLNIGFLLLITLMLLRFLRTGGIDMLQMMEVPKSAGHRHKGVP